MGEKIRRCFEKHMRGRNSLPHSEPIEISIYHALSPTHQSLSRTSEICSDRVEVLRFTTSSSLRWAATTMTTTSPAMQKDNPLPPPQPQPQASEGNRADDEAFQPKSSSYLVMNQHQRRRRPGATAALTKPSSPTRQRSITRDIGHAAAETYLMTHLAIKLLRYLGVGYRWILKVLILLFYAMLLLPGFLQVAYYYVFSSQVRRSIVYGYQPRNRLDLYLPKNSKSPKAVLIFVTGGAWIIGYKAWGALLGKQLAERDIIVACIDYRNFPQGTMSDMVADVSAGISFVCNSVAELGGDPNRIFLMGQSAGAHISSCALLEHAIKESKGENVSWSVSQIKAYFGLSGGYNMPGLVDHFHRRGLYRSIFSSIMEGEKGLQRFSPEIRVQDPSIRDAVSMLPHIILFHGTADYSIPSEASEAFVDALKKAGAKVELIVYPGKTHTDLFLHDPMRGGKEELFDFLVGFIHDGDKEALAKNEVAPLRPRLCPEFLLKLAHRVSPF